jgi:hypothetical protein
MWRPLFVAWCLPAGILTLVAAAQSRFGAVTVAEHDMWVYDLPVLAGITVILFSLRWAPIRAAPPAAAKPPLPPGFVDLFAFTVVLAVGWGGHHLVFEGFAFSRDENLALFQAALIAKGKLAAEIPEAWRGLSKALQPFFMREAPGDAAWLSGYLPVNSALQSLGIVVGVGGIVSPLLAAGAAIATHRVGRRLWPNQPGQALLAPLLLVSSAQFLLTAMTPYAMTAHLAANMVWLWCFLRGDRLGFIGSIGVGFLAVGLHQLIFHPLFVAPFILQLMSERRWRPAIGYVIAYAGICLFWTLYWGVATGGLGAAAPSVASGLSQLIGDVVGLVSQFDGDAPGIMAMLLARFISWQNPLTISLMLLGSVAAWRAGGVRRALIVGIGLSVAALTVVLPEQGNGWGYRYLHGFLGSACILAAWTWRDLTGALDQGRRQIAATTLTIVTAVAIFFLAPLRAWQANSVLRPFIDGRAAIEAMSVDLVLVDPRAIHAGEALIRNDPDLANRPLTLHARFVTDDQLARLCANHTVAVLQATDARRLGLQTEKEPAAARAAREAGVLARLRAAGCRAQ